MKLKNYRSGLIVLSAAFLSSSAWASTITVGFSPGPGNYATLDAAVTAAAPNDTIQIAAGTFVLSDKITIQKTLHIKGAGKAQTILIGAGSPDGPEEPLIFVDALPTHNGNNPNAGSNPGIPLSSGTTIEDLTLGGWQNGGNGQGYLLWTGAVRDVEVKNVSFSSNTNRCGFYADNCNDLILKNSDFTGTFYRLAYRGSGRRLTIQDNNFDVTDPEKGGILLFEYSRVTSALIKGNSFRHTVSGTSYTTGAADHNTIANINSLDATDTPQGLNIENNTFQFIVANANSLGKYPIPVAILNKSSANTLSQSQGAATSITGNTFTGYDYLGTDVTKPAFITTHLNSVVTGNAFTSRTKSSVILTGTGTPLLDATGNFWGSLAGPAASDTTGSVDTGSFVTTVPPAVIARVSIQGKVGTYLTITEGIANAVANDTVLLAPGLYQESVIIDKDIDLTGDGNSSTIVSSPGAVISIVAAGSGATVTGIGVTGGTRGFNLNGVSNVLLDSVSSTGNTSFGVNFDGASSAVTLKNSSFSNNGSTGIKVTSSSRVNNLTINSCTVNGNLFGIYAADGNAATYQANAQLEGLTINNGSTFSNNTNKGIYIESMNNGVFDGIEVVNSGQGSTGATGSGIDINLKYANYSNLTIRNSLVSGCGQNNSFGGGILVKAQNTGSYAANPATLGGTVLLEGLRIENNGKAGLGAGIRVGDSNANTSPTNVEIKGSTFGGNTQYAVLNLIPTGTITATHNHWSAPAGPIGAVSNGVGGDVTFNPWFVSSDASTPPVLSDLRSGIIQDITIDQVEPNVADLYVAPGTTITVTPTGSLSATELELAAGATLIVNEGKLAIGEDTVISGTFTVFNSFGSWDINGNTTFNIGQSLALISDIHIAGGKTLTVNGGGELILDGCVIDSKTAGTPYNITTGMDGVLTMARNVVTDANISINTSNGSVPANVVSRVYDNSFTNSAIAASADAKVYHNILANTTIGTGAAFADVDGWGNVTSAANVQNKFTLDFDAPAAIGRTLDTAGNLFVQTGDTVAMRMDVSALGTNSITAAEALLGYNSNMLTLPATPTVVAPQSALWEVILEDITQTPPSSLGMVDSALGLQLTAGQPGSSADETLAKVNFTAASAGRTLGFFRVQTNDEFDGNGRFMKDSRLTKTDASAISGFSYLAAFTANTGELVIDNEKPVIDTGTILGTQVQPSQASAVNVLVPTARVFRNGTAVKVSFNATDNGHGLSGLDAADVANDLVFTASNGTTTLNSSNYTVVATDNAGVVTYALDLTVPTSATTGTYVISATVQDRSGNVSDATVLGSFIIANEALVNVELQGFVGTTRDVTFVATGGAMTTWTKTITNFVGGVGSVVLEDVPAGTTHISAKSAWTLRNKVTAPFTPEGVGSASLTGTNLLRAGDITGDNVINTLDYSVLRYNWLTNNAVSDITGNGATNTNDYNVMKTNFYTVGSAQ